MQKRRWIDCRSQRGWMAPWKQSVQDSLLMYIFKSYRSPELKQYPILNKEQSPIDKCLKRKKSFHQWKNTNCFYHNQGWSQAQSIWPTQNRPQRWFCRFFCLILFCKSDFISLVFFCVLWFLIVGFLCSAFSLLLLLFIYFFLLPYLFCKEREIKRSWMGGEVEQIWEEKGKAKPSSKCIEFLYDFQKTKNILSKQITVDHLKNK